MSSRNEIRADSDGPTLLTLPGSSRDSNQPASKNQGGRPVQLVALEDEGSLSVAEPNAERLVEEMRIIKRRLLGRCRSDSRVRGNIIMVGSALPGDGKSFVAYNLAKSLSRDQDHEVVLIDGDFKKPHLTRSFDLQEEPGFLNVLAGETTLNEVSHATEEPRLTFIAAGTGNDRANELLASNGAQLLLDTQLAASSGKIVVFDSAPVLRASETQVLAQLVGQVVMVIRAGHTPRKAFVEALKVLGGTENCTFVLNDADDVPLSRYSASGYGYGYGYGYGKK